MFPLYINTPKWWNNSTVYHRRSLQPLLQLDFPSRTGISFYNRSTACFRRAISLFLRKQSGGWQQQGVSLENNKHQSRKISNLVVLQQKSALHVNWTVTERLISSFCFPSRKLPLYISVVPFPSYFLLCHCSVCVCASGRTLTAAAAVADCCQPCPAWPTLYVTGIGEGLFQPAKEKPLYVASVVMEK